MALIEEFILLADPIPAEIPIEPPPSYEPTADADGYAGWLSVGIDHSGHTERLAALAALLAAAHIGFKMPEPSGGWICVSVKKPDRKALEVIWELTKLVDVQAPPVLKINIDKMLKTEEAQEVFEPVPEIEGSRFDDI